MKLWYVKSESSVPSTDLILLPCFSISLFSISPFCHPERSRTAPFSIPPFSISLFCHPLVERSHFLFPYFLFYFSFLPPNSQKKSPQSGSFLLKIKRLKLVFDEFLCYFIAISTNKSYKVQSFAEG